jgi:hypothetical protein
MTPQEMPAPQAAAPGKTVQDYIDETPVWADATPVRHSPMTLMQWLCLLPSMHLKNNGQPSH